MRSLIAALVIAIVAIGFGVAYARGPQLTQMTEATVVLKDSGFEPEMTRITRGGTVTFRNERENPFWPASDLHPSHGLYAEFDPMRPLDPGEQWSFRFDRVGTWDYHDHLRSYYVGTIHVSE